MDSRAMPKNDSSLCEKSMEVVANIIRLSSFSIALKTFGTTAGKTPRRPSTSESEYADDQVNVGKRSERPKGRGNPTYVTYPVPADGSTSHVEEQKVRAKHKKEESVDLLAAKFIEQKRKELGFVSHKT